MPKTPKGAKRPADVVRNAVLVMKIATGEIEEESTTREKNEAAAELGRRGGTARASKLSPGRRTAIARKAARARHEK